MRDTVYFVVSLFVLIFLSVYFFIPLFVMIFLIHCGDLLCLGYCQQRRRLRLWIDDALVGWIKD